MKCAPFRISSWPLNVITVPLSWLHVCMDRTASVTFILVVWQCAAYCCYVNGIIVII